MEGDVIKRRSGGKFVNIVIGSFAVIGVVLAAFCFLIKEPIDPPRPAMPNPNAFDAYSNAVMQQLDTNKINYAFNTTHTSGNVDDHEYSLAQQKKLIEENSPAFEEIRKGLNQEYFSPPSLALSRSLKPLSEFRGLARMLWLDAKVKEETGDWKGAANSALDSIKMGGQVPRGGELTAYLVGLAIQSGGRKELKLVVSHLSAEEAKAVERRLETIISSRTPYIETLRDTARSNKAEMTKTIPNLPIVRTMYLGYYHSGMKKIMDEIEMPYPQRSIDRKMRKANLFYGLLAETWLTAGFKYEQNRTNFSFLSISLALHAYKKEHGNFPKSLDDLVPGYLSKLPDDPFAMKGGFKYKLNGDQYLLYSLGPDGKDDGGKAIDFPNNPNAKKNKNARYFPDEKSVGDIVAGTND